MAMLNVNLGCPEGTGCEWRKPYFLRLSFGGWVTKLSFGVGFLVFKFQVYLNTGLNINDRTSGGLCWLHIRFVCFNFFDLCVGLPVWWVPWRHMEP